MKTNVGVVLVTILCLVVGCATGKTASKQAVQATLQSHSAFLQSMPDDREEFDLARRGLIASEPVVDIRTAEGQPVWEMQSYQFLAPDKPAPETVHPGLWHHAQRTAIHGLFKVTDRIYQVRGYDISAITFIEGKTGYIVVDPLVSSETARAAMELFFKHLPKKPVTAVIYTHNHLDHWGGVKGVVTDGDVRAGKVRIIAPAGFMKETISENIMAGNAMTRRATYMFGVFLPRGPTGQVDGGMGKGASTGTFTLIAPTEEVERTGQEMTIDGVHVVFQLCPGTEAPAEMNFYLPDFKALCIPENTTASLHNLLTPRGALIRDGKAWASYIDEAIDLFGDRVEVCFNTHHWPRWGRDAIVHYLKQQRDLYKYIHDQTLHLINQGYTMNECAEMIRLPESLAGEWYNRDFYGTVNFNVKAVYQRYLGWFDANPANLHPLPPVEASKRYVEFMGGADAVMTKARDYLRKGEYRWVAQVMNHVVFADPENKEARELQADALEQLGYAAESPIWRNFYLTGAMELREGIPKMPRLNVGSLDIVKAMTLDMYFDYLAILLDASKAAGRKITVDWIFTDTNQVYSVTMENSVLNHKAGRRSPAPDATVFLTREVLDEISLKRATFPGRILAGEIKVEGSRGKFLEMLSCLEQFEFWFDIVRP